MNHQYSVRFLFTAKTQSNDLQTINIPGRKDLNLYIFDDAGIGNYQRANNHLTLLL